METDAPPDLSDANSRNICVPPPRCSPRSIEIATPARNVQSETDHRWDAPLDSGAGTDGRERRTTNASDVRAAADNHRNESALRNGRSRRARHRDPASHCGGKWAPKQWSTQLSEGGGLGGPAYAHRDAKQASVQGKTQRRGKHGK